MKIIECPRDAMQGLSTFIPTADKVRYLNKLLAVGFDTIDFGSFVSPKAIPQMKDTAAVLEQLNWRQSKSRLLAIVANTRGATDAAGFEAITYLGFPLSISETFQIRNTNKTLSEALSSLDEIQNVCINAGKTLVTYLSMGFGNPYGDPYSVELVTQFAGILQTLGVKIISVADTVGVSKPENIGPLFRSLSAAYPGIEFGAHLHSTPETAVEKIKAAFEAGCRRFDGAIRGYGGCPMAGNDLVGNIATESIISYLAHINIESGINVAAFQEAQLVAESVFPPTVPHQD
jgi:hydroxymethylglutaryl-CoA lyase